MNISPKLITDTWKGYQPIHAAMNKRYQYYEGKHSFLRTERNNDGSAKNNTPVNFCRYVVDMHSAASTSIPISYTSKSDDQDPMALDNLSTVIDSNDVRTIDCEHFTNSLVAGYSVELHSFSNEEIQVTQYDPREWAFIFDSAGTIHVAIHRAELQANTIYRDALLEKNTCLWTVYTDALVSEYTSLPDKNELFLQGEQLHFYGKVPVVLFFLNGKRTTFLSDEILGQNNSYNKILNARVDEIEFNVDSFLKIQGVDPKDPDLLKKIRKMKEDRTIVLPDKNSDFAFINKSNDTEKYRESLADSREALLNQASVPDMKEIFGATGATSGLALRFKFMPMIQQASLFTRYYEKGIKQRIELLNRIWFLSNQPLLTDYAVDFSFNLPVDIPAERASLKSLEGIVSKRTLLTLHPEIDNPEEELQRLEEENGNPAVQAQADTATQPTEAPSKPAKPFKENPSERLADRAKALENGAGSLEKQLGDRYRRDLQASIPEKVDADLKAFFAKWGEL